MAVIGTFHAWALATEITCEVTPSFGRLLALRLYQLCDAGCFVQRQKELGAASGFLDVVVMASRLIGSLGSL